MCYSVCIINHEEFLLMQHGDFKSTTILSGTVRHRQNGEGTIRPKGTIVEKKKGDWIWWLLSAILLVSLFVGVHSVKEGPKKTVNTAAKG